MKSISKITIFVTVFMLAAVILSCSDSEHKLSPLLKHATVIINLGMPPENPSAYDDSILNRIRRFFVPDAIAQTAPATFSNILVRVSGPDIGIIEQNFGPIGTISLDVLAGSLRQFEVIANVSPLDPSAALSFRGTAIANLPEGETVSVPVVMLLNEVKLVIPDPAGFNNRIVQINDISGAGWIEKIATDIGFAGTFVPYDVDFDARGRIYIANNSGSTESVVIRINNLYDNQCKTFPLGGTGNGLYGIAVDRIRNYVYYSTLSTLRKCDLNGNGDTVITIAGGTVSQIRGIDVDQATGNVYLACNLGAVAAIPSVALLTISGTAGTLAKSQALSGVGITSWDVAVKPPAVFVTQAVNVSNDARNRVTQFDMGLTIATSLIVDPTKAPFLAHTPPDFFGPDRIIAPMNRRLTFIDEDQIGNFTDRLAGFDDILGNGAATYGTSGSFIGEFFFLFWNGG